jgi:hypothetical protein
MICGEDFGGVFGRMRMWVCTPPVYMYKLVPSTIPLHLSLVSRHAMILFGRPKHVSRPCSCGLLHTALPQAMVCLHKLIAIVPLCNTIHSRSVFAHSIHCLVRQWSCLSKILSLVRIRELIQTFTTCHRSLLLASQTHTKECSAPCIIEQTAAA